MPPMATRMQEHERQRECEGDQPRTQALLPSVPVSIFGLIS